MLVAGTVVLLAVSLVLMPVLSHSRASVSITLAAKYLQRQDRFMFPPSSNPSGLAAALEPASAHVAGGDPGSLVSVVWSGPPLTTPRGIVRGPDAIYVADPGRSAKPGVAGIFAPARIIRFPLSGNRVGAPEVFFEDGTQYFEPPVRTHLCNVRAIY